MRTTSNVLERMCRDNVDPLKIIDKFYRFLDKHLAGAYGHNKCTKGCSACCHVQVALPAIEAYYIEQRTGNKITNWEMEKVDITKSSPCTFLKNGECSIYEHRPGACRVFMTFDDPAICHDDNAQAHWVVSLQEPGNGGMEWANVLYFNIMTSQTKRLPKDKQIIKDIRSYFK